MGHLTDLALYDRHGQLVALVLVKNIRGTTREWAAEYRRNLRSHAGWPPVDFFLLVTPDRLYLWEEGASASATDVVLPRVVDAGPLLGPYFDRLRSAHDSLSGPAFEFLVTGWLRDLMSFGSGEGPLELEKTGFPKSIRDGHLEIQDAA